MHFLDRPVRPDSVAPPAGSFSNSMTVTLIPDDSRSFWMVGEARGTGSSYDAAPYLNLRASNILYPGITSLAWASCEGSPPTGNVWVAADGGLFEVNLFLQSPVPSTWHTSLANTYLARPTAANQILYVDGVNGVAEVLQIDPCTRVITTYALTSDSGFTRPIWPSGIAADPDGSCCYIADANLGRLVKIPAGNSQPIADGWGGWGWSFNDPCGMDVGLDHNLYAVDGDGWLGEVYGRYSTWWSQLDQAAGTHCLDIDRDVSTPSLSRFVYDAAPFCDAYNRNGIEDVPGNPVRYHGGRVFAEASGKLRLDVLWTYTFARHFPQRVLLSRQNQPVGYPSEYQNADRIIELKVWGWAGVPIQLRVIDPADFSPYVPDGGCLQGGCTPAPPYEANDNLGLTDYGLTTDPYGSGATSPLKVTPESGNYALVYLKVPPNVSGNNFQVEATKCTPGGTVLPEKLTSLSPVYTTWKRVYVERDKMFRRGGLLFDDFNAGSCSPNCNQIVLYDWANIVDGDTIVVFDETSTYEKPDREVVTVSGTPLDNHNGSVTVTLSADLTKNYYRSSQDTSNPPKPIFTNGHSAGVGVISGCDSASNQINASNSCFYDADLRDIQQTFNDGYVEFTGQADGMGAVPYIAPSWFDSSDPLAAVHRGRFSQIWFSNKEAWSPPNWHLDQPHNYFHLVGASAKTLAAGLTIHESNMSLIFRKEIETLCPACSPSEKDIATRETTSHEIVHQFRVNCCDPERHDSNVAWCSGVYGQCDNPILGYEYCLMHASDALYWDMRKDGIAKLDCDDMADAGPDCGVPDCANGVSVRTDTDPE